MRGPFPVNEGVGNFKHDATSCIDLGAVVNFPLATETAVVNWPSIATGEGHFVLGSYTLTVPFTTAMKLIVKKYVANAALRLGRGYGRRATD